MDLQEQFSLVEGLFGGSVEGNGLEIPGVRDNGVTVDKGAMILSPTNIVESDTYDAAEYAPNAIPIGNVKHSDSEVIFSFATRESQKQFVSYAKMMGLVDGEFDADGSESLQGDGRYYVRLMPHVRFTKPAIFKSLVDALGSAPGLEGAMFYESDEGMRRRRRGSRRRGREIDMDYVDEVVEEYLLERKRPTGLHAPDTGEFASLGEIKRKGGGSYSLQPEKPKRVKPGKKGFKKLETKQPCGRIVKSDPPNWKNRSPYKCSGGITRGKKKAAAIMKDKLTDFRRKKKRNPTDRESRAILRRTMKEIHPAPKNEGLMDELLMILDEAGV